MYAAAHKDPRGGHNRSKINQNFFKSWSPKMAYVLGFVFADGAIEDVQKSSRTCYLTITVTSKDVLVLEKIRDAIKSNHKFYFRNAQEMIFPNGKKYICKERTILRIGCKLMYNNLLELGVTPRKSLTALFPTVPTEYLFHFLRGYFDGDGCIHLIKDRFPRIIFTSGSKKFLEGLSKVLSETLQIPLKPVYAQLQDSNNYCYRLHYNTKMSRIILQLMYKNLEQAPYLERKYAIYQKYLKGIS